ncbi:spore germination protein GerPB [Neobacillus drentensis]|jgi:spore germination protein PB|uniref:spore germination protein GerPB n=1 Tax=Neobacillus drentensis TaxID=220684 RepID=UPI002FFEBFFE
MNYYIQQSIQISFIRIGSISNSSVMQIGSAGMIKPSAYLYNTGGFTAPAPSPKPIQALGSLVGTPAVPLQAAVRKQDNPDGDK